MNTPPIGTETSAFRIRAFVHFRWLREMMFCTNHISIDEWAEQAQEVIKNLKGRKLKFAKSMPLHQFGLVLYIEALFSKWCPYDDMSWIYEY